MLRAGAFVQRRFRWGALGLATLLAVTAITTDADARGRRHRHATAAAESYEPSYASIVVDANSGAVMQAANADSPRHPASLTKIMTLYLLFERLEAGKIKLVDRNAGLRPRRRAGAVQARPEARRRPSTSKPRSAPSSPNRPTTWR